jgi:hypothetical protein
MENKSLTRRVTLRLSDSEDMHLVTVVDGLRTDEQVQLMKQVVRVLHFYPRMSNWALQLIWWLHEPRRRREHKQYRKQLAAQRAAESL